MEDERAEAAFAASVSTLSTKVFRREEADPTANYGFKSARSIQGVWKLMSYSP